MADRVNAVGNEVRVREEDGMELIKNGAAVLYKLTAAVVNGFLSLRAIT
jgi:hypothetical protein